LRETHGTVLRTLEYGPDFKLLIVQAEHGKSALEKKRLKDSKEVAVVESNDVFKVSDSPNPHPNLPRVLKQQAPGSGPRQAAQFSLPAGPSQPGSRQLTRTQQLVGPGQLGNAKIPNDPEIPSQWALPVLGYKYWTGNFNATDVRAYLIDSGLSPNADFQTRLALQFDMSGVNPTFAREALHDVQTHGTAVATPLCYTDNFRGYAGVADSGPRTHIYTVMLRVFDNGNTFGRVNVIYALYFILLHPNYFPPGPINISLGSTVQGKDEYNSDYFFQRLFYYLYQKGFIVYLAAGNQPGKDMSPTYFAARVTGLDENLSAVNFETGPGIVRAAPGENVEIYRGPNDNDLGEGRGTSYATSLWTGCCAYILSLLPPGTTPIYADRILTSTATKTPEGLLIPNLEAAALMAVH
jgi:subtilisin family serine protease